MDRETIHAALFTKLSSAAAFGLKSRRWRAIEDVNVSDCPALFLVWVEDDIEQDEYAGAKVIEHFEAWVYVDVGMDANAVPVQTVIAITDALQNSLVPQGEPRQTLGGLVYSCVVQGKVETDRGMLGAKSYAIMPIKVVTTD